MKTTTTALLALAAALAPLAAPALPAQDAAHVASDSARPRLPVDRIVAVVGKEPILFSDVREYIALNTQQGQVPPQESPEYARLATQILNLLIDKELLVQRAKELKIEVADNDITERVDQKFNEVKGNFKEESEFRAQLRLSGFGTPEEYRRFLTDQARRDMYQQRLFEKLRTDGKLPPAAISDKDVETYFQQNVKDLPKVPASVGFRQVVIRPASSAPEKERARVKAESLLVEIRRGGDFAQIAKRESMDPGSKELGGDLGWHRRGDFVPEFERFAFGLNPGQLSPVFESPYGFHILKVDRAQPGEVKVRHILIRPAVDSTDVALARHLADSIATAWRNGASYDTLVARFHDRDEEKVFPINAIARAQLPQAYQTAFTDRKVNDITAPFELPDALRGVPKLAIAQITDVSDEHEATLKEFREQVREQLAQERGTRRFLDNLRKQTFVDVRLAEVLPAAKDLPATKP